MSDTRLSTVVSRSYNGMSTAYRAVRHVLKPNPKLVLGLIAMILVGGTLTSLGYLLTGNIHLTPATNPLHTAAIASLYAIDLLAIYTVGAMLRRLTNPPQ